MVIMGIIISQLSVDGDPNQSRDDIVIDEEVTVYNVSTAGITDWKWELLDKPDGSTAVFDTPTESIARFTPDVEGSYLIGLTANHTIKRTIIAAILTSNFGIRIPAIGETNEFSGGWAAAVKTALFILDRDS